jgi:hypothetical protein
LAYSSSDELQTVIMSTMVHEKRVASTREPRISARTSQGIPGKSGLTLIELIVVAVVITLLIVVILPFARRHVQARRYYWACVWPGRYCSVVCRPAKESFQEGELVTLVCDISNTAGYRLDYRWDDRVFMLSTEQPPTEDRGYPVPPDTIKVSRAEAILLDKSGRQCGVPPERGDIRLNPSETIRFTIRVGAARGHGFKGKVMAECVGGIPGRTYDLTDPVQVQIIDDRYFLSNEFQYRIVQTEKSGSQEETGDETH